MAALVLLLVAQAFAAPLLAWTSESIAVPNSLLRAGSETSLADFQSSFVSGVFEKKGLAILFLQDQLSMADITMYGGVHGENTFSLKNTKAAFEAATSAYALSNVLGGNGKTSTTLLKAFIAQAQITGGQTLFATAHDLATLPLGDLSATAMNVIVAQMPSVNGDGTVSAEKLAANDAFIGSLLTAVAAKYHGALSCMLLATGDDHVSVHSMRRSLGASVSVPNIPSIPTFPSGASQFPAWTPFTASFERPITKSYLYFTIPLFMGIMVMFIFIFFILTGINGVSWTQTPLRWADTTDKCLIVPDN